MEHRKTVAILGEGAWGTAIATLLAHNGYTVKLWCHDPAVKQSIERQHTNDRYMPGFVLDTKIIPFTNLQEVLADCTWIFEAIPVQFLRSVLEQCKPFVTDQQRWVILSKGIEQETLLLPSQMLKNIFGSTVPVAAVMGPSFAHDVMNKVITGVSVAAEDCTIGTKLQKLLANEYFRPYLSLDLVGVQVGAAFKNVIGLGLGMLEGANYPDNTRALLFTRGMQEIMQLCIALGGKQQTVYGLSGVGDLVLSALGKQSRNVAVGRMLGKGASLQSILDETGYIPEGINTVKSIHALMQKHSLDLPVCFGIYHIIFSSKKIADFLQELMAKPLENECV